METAAVQASVAPMRLLTSAEIAAVVGGYTIYDGPLMFANGNGANAASELGYNFTGRSELEFDSQHGQWIDHSYCLSLVDRNDSAQWITVLAPYDHVDHEKK